ncbi:hypothetical protein F5884DRAFT_788306 [Xylogone sp. PMI_703]|nr:hypothetical protein F5884DRAFT_788306 [Xylogone sp. PMI_703]
MLLSSLLFSLCRSCHSSSRSLLLNSRSLALYCLSFSLPRYLSSLHFSLSCLALSLTQATTSGQNGGGEVVLTEYTHKPQDYQHRPRNTAENHAVAPSPVTVFPAARYRCTLP